MIIIKLGLSCIINYTVKIRIISITHASSGNPLIFSGFKSRYNATLPNTALMCCHPQHVWPFMIINPPSFIADSCNCQRRPKSEPLWLKGRLLVMSRLPFSLLTTTRSAITTLLVYAAFQISDFRFQISDAIMTAR